MSGMFIVLRPVRIKKTDMTEIKLHAVIIAICSLSERCLERNRTMKVEISAKANQNILLIGRFFLLIARLF